MNKYHSQNNEAKLSIEYFGDRQITILDVGANDGKTFSNSYDLIVRGAKAYLFEPSSVCDDLIKLHQGNPNVHIYNKGLGDKVGKVKFYESGAHVRNGRDRALVSATDYKETIRWRKAGVEFIEKEITVLDWLGWYEHSGQPKFEMVSLDTEGMEWTILQQMDLGLMGVEFLIIEWNGDVGLEKLFAEYCDRYGLVEVSRNNENLIFAKTKEG